MSVIVFDDIKVRAISNNLLLPHKMQTQTDFMICENKIYAVILRMSNN